MSEIHYNVFSLPAALMIEHDMADGLVQTLNNYLDKERLSQDKKSAGDSLIGQIHQGEQLEMDYELEELKLFRTIVENLGVSYLRHFVEFPSHDRRRCKMIVNWVVISSIRMNRPEFIH